MSICNPSNLEVDRRLVLVPPALRGLHRRVPLHFEVDFGRFAAVRAAVPLGVDVDADDRVLRDDLDVDVLAAPTTIRVRRLRLNAALEQRHDVMFRPAAALSLRLPFQDVQYGPEGRRVFDPRRHRRALHLLLFWGRQLHLGGRRM